MRLPAELLIARYSQNLFGAAFAVLKNAADAEDAVQDALIKYHQSDLQFEDEEHIRAWLFRCTINRAKDMRRSFFRSHKVSLENYENYVNTLSFETREDGQLFETVMSMPYKERIVLQLFYYEDYSIREIASVLDIKEDAAKKRLSRARKKLKEILEEEWEDEQ